MDVPITFGNGKEIKTRNQFYENMQAFGIELRKKNNVQHLYADVDLVLKQNGIGKQCVGMSVQQQTTAHAIQKMMQADRWFDVCTIDRCAKLCQICIPIERQRVYDAAHCIHWNEMLPDFKTILTAMVLDDFRSILCAE